MRLKLVLISSIFLTACASIKDTSQPVQSVQQVAKIPKYLINDNYCTPSDFNGSTYGDIILYLKIVNNTLDKCRQNRALIINWLLSNETPKK